ncbi:helix-turn-helix transcriptional regulator [Serratia marcescens]|uniref:helix-turn-helix domain-containing protein n=1 Tax=Serratia marcescens TaxID=615 RepID=UPI0023AE6D72|nr:helix-turn-helix transcriptional regulator [Serratia marcescens]WEE06829.1 helix-turn-helix transcriptional regulator [Serratia marcescens]
MTENDTIAKRMIERRAELGLSQEKLAEIAGIAPAQISRYESGKNRPRAPALIKLARALGVTFSWLSFGNGAKETVEKKEDGSVVLNLSFSKETMAMVKANAKLRGMTLEQYLNWLLDNDLKG